MSDHLPEMAQLMERNAELVSVLKEAKIQLQMARAEMGATDDLSARQHALSVASWYLKRDGDVQAGPDRVVEVARQFHAFLTSESDEQERP